MTDIPGRIFVVSSPSGAGKSTLCRRVLAMRPELVFSVSFTTRSMRPGERDGREYRFVDDSRFDGMIARDEFIEWASVHGRRYGTSAAETERLLAAGRSVIFDVDVQGARNIRRRFAESVLIFIYPPSPSELARRLRGRKTDQEAEISRRLAAAIEEIRESRSYDFAVVNDNLDRAVTALLDIVDGRTENAVRPQAYMKEIENEFGMKHESI